jgi:hypothetical protein
LRCSDARPNSFGIRAAALKQQAPTLDDDLEAACASSDFQRS